MLLDLYIRVRCLGIMGWLLLLVMTSVQTEALLPHTTAKPMTLAHPKLPPTNHSNQTRLRPDPHPPQLGPMTLAFVFTLHPQPPSHPPLHVHLLKLLELLLATREQLVHLLLAVHVATQLGAALAQQCLKGLWGTAGRQGAQQGVRSPWVEGGDGTQSHGAIWR